MCPSQVHKIGGPFLRDWSRVDMERDNLRLHPLHVSRDYIGSWSVYAYAFSKVEKNVLSSITDRICHDLDVRLYHAPRSV